ncbi:MAG: helix-turn-helix transcriptional regulator [Bacteroidetes bacterium]|nr:helix-turn-helix transcriptional regulator [Bacteroidota bacterium]
MTKVKFLDSSIIEVVAKDGEVFTLKAHLPVHPQNQDYIKKTLTKYFTECFEDDKSSMVYWILMKMLTDVGFGFSYVNSDRSADRERIGARIRQIREQKGMEAKHLAMLSGIDAANLSRIEQGRYSVGLDVISKIAEALCVKVDLTHRM